MALTPEVILAAGGSVVGPLQQMTRTVPIVFILVTDPVGSGYVASLARPGGNATGFTEWEFGRTSKMTLLTHCHKRKMDRNPQADRAGCNTGRST